MTTHVIKCNPTTPGQRNRVKIVHDHLYKGRPMRSLIDTSVTSSYGRNSNGRITTRHRSGRLGNRRLYRTVDFKRMKDGIQAKVARIEYRPYRSAHLALISYKDGAAYIIAAEGMRGVM